MMHFQNYDLQEIKLPDKAILMTKKMSEILDVHQGDILLGSVMLYNLGSLSFAEKVREMATLKVLGFRTKTIRNILRIQNIWITVIGIGIGIPLGKQFLTIVCGNMSEGTDFPVILHIQYVFLAIVITYAASEFINWLMSRHVKNIDMVEALKGAE